eukprot:s564_g3.t1
MESRRATIVLILLDFATVVSLFVAATRPFSNRLVDLILLGGRVLGGSFLSTFAVRLALGHWPWTRGNGHDLAEVQRELTRAISGEEPPRARQAPLLASSFASSGGDAVAQQLDDTVSSRQQELKKLERGQNFSKAVTYAIYVFFAMCSMRTAIEVVSLPSSDFWSSFWIVVQVFGLPIMQIEFVLMKGLIQAATAGESFVRCSLCNEKVGELTGGYLTLQCRTCAPNRWGFGGFNVCTACYRKNAVKAGAAGEASGAGILRGDKGPKYAQPMTVMQYMRRLSGLVRGSTLAVVLVCVCGSQFFGAYIPKAQGDTISAMTRFSDEEFDQRILEFALLVVANAISSLQTRMSANMSVKLFGALLRQDVAFYDNAMTGQLSSRLNNDMRQALSPVSIIMNSFVANIVMLAVGFGICLQSSWRLTVLAFTVLTPVVHISAEFSTWASKLMMWTYLADASGSATQALTNIRTVRMFGARDIEMEKYAGHINKSKDLGLRSAWGQGAAGLISALVQQGASFIILFYGGHLALKHEFEVGSIITFTVLWNRLSSAFTSLNENINQPAKAVSAGQRVFEILDLEPDIPEEEGEAFPEESKQVGIRFENVEYAYLSRPDKKVLAGVTLDIRAGKTTAVVGKSGCGKSTLSKLVLRFYDPQGGAVFLNATELQRMHLLQYRKKVGVVSQDTQLFRMTVTENITYGLRATEYTMEDVERAANLANADEFIRALPEGYSTMVGESGHDLSGGQKQRLSIARALVRRPRILLLDEATSALDAENEAMVQAALDSLMQQMQGSCTIMVIAHRLSTIKDADRIIVLHEGEVVEQGTHDELLQTKEGRYATMIARQLQGGSADGEEEGKGNEKKVEDAVAEIMAILELVKEDQRKDVERLNSGSISLHMSDKLYSSGTPPGVVMGLAWTANGGATLYVEARGRLPDGRVQGGMASLTQRQEEESRASTEQPQNGAGKGHMQVTGQLGTVMSESSSISLTYARLFMRELDSNNKFLDTASIHLHVPEGATPKDGPSAGVTMTSALVSTAFDVPLLDDIAMTGELTLMGKVLKVGGIKEKVIAARREGVKTLLLPRQNEADFMELKEYLRAGMTAHFVDHYDDVYKLAFDQTKVPPLSAPSRGLPVITVVTPEEVVAEKAEAPSPEADSSASEGQPDPLSQQPLPTGINPRPSQTL